MEYNRIGENMVEVSMTHQVVLGRIVRMVPSDGYCGVDFGVARVIGISGDDLETWNIHDGYHHTLDEIHASVRGHMEAELSLYETHTTEYVERESWLLNQPWVAYEYTRGSDGGTYVFPLELFLDHSLSGS